MRFDMSFLAWVVTRRLPVFALVATSVFLLGNFFIAPKPAHYIAQTEMAFSPIVARPNLFETDPRTRFELLRYQVISSTDTLKAAELAGFSGQLSKRIAVRLNGDDRIMSIRVQAEQPQAALEISRNVALQFETLAQKMIDTELRTVPEFEPTGLPASQEPVLQVSLPTAIVGRVNGTDMQTLYLILLVTAIVSGLAAIAAVQSRDPVIRRPRDLERALGIRTFGVIPDLSLRPVRFQR